jgi:hypothetical protein
MATDYSNYPDVRAKYEAYSKLQSRLYGYKGYSGIGLASALDNAAAKFGETDSRYLKIKKEFDDTKVKLEAAKKAYEDIRKAVDDKVAEDKQAKVDAKKKKEDQASVGTLQAQLDSARRQGDTAKVAELTKQINDIKNPVKPGEGQKDDSFTGGINPADYTIYTDTAGNTYVTGVGSTKEFFVVPPKTAGGTIDAPVADINVARNKLIQEFGGTEKLKVALKQAGYNSGNFYNDANGFLRAYSVNSMQSYIDGKGKGTLPTFAEAAKTIASQNAAGATKTRVEQAFTDRGGADRYINVYMMDMVGRPATSEEKAAFYKSLNAAESKTRTATTTVADGNGGYKSVKSVGSSLTDTDRLLIATGVVQKSLKGVTNIDNILTGKKGSKIATDVASLRKVASDYGLPIDSMTAFKYSLEGLGQTDLIAKQTERLRQLAIQMYPTLKDHILSGGTVKDVADTYAYARTRKLGVVVKDSTLDKKVMGAVTSGKTLADWDREMQGEAEWGKTEEAHNIAADFTKTILSSFGFGGN